ncbi:MAG: MarR family transcriptional regulator [Myxococcaceae bacterium]|nr:MarR family transcriptional regulator [Myxococcaceae bacterium]MCI0670126.1 MarR family transcriptional regulator [Myxococcaceae bacterium]
MADSTPSPALQLGNQLCFAVYAATHAFTRVYKPLLEPLGLTYPQYLVLLLLWERDDRSVKELGEPLFLDSGTLTPLLKRMEASGYVTRRRDPTDERTVRVSLAAKGRALREKAPAIPEALFCASGLSVEQLASLRRAITEVSGRLRESAKEGPASPVRQKPSRGRAPAPARMRRPR